MVNNDDDKMRWDWEDVLKDTQLEPGVNVLQKPLQTPGGTLAGGPSWTSHAPLHGCLCHAGLL